MTLNQLATNWLYLLLLSHRTAGIGQVFKKVHPFVAWILQRWIPSPVLSASGESTSSVEDTEFEMVCCNSPFSKIISVSGNKGEDSLTWIRCRPSLASMRACFYLEMSKRMSKYIFLFVCFTEYKSLGKCFWLNKTKNCLIL